MKGFDPQYYLESNPDVAASGGDPYEHYITYGRSEGRLPHSPPFWYRILTSKRVQALKQGRFGYLISKIQGWLLALSGLGNTVSSLEALIDGRNDYKNWMHEYEQPIDNHTQTSLVSPERLPWQPVISILMPTFESNLIWLEEAIESIRSQIYPNWELCIADDASTDPKLRDYLRAESKKDSRIKVFFREHNGHISESSNSALDICNGEFIALMDHDDLLTKDALFWIVEMLNRNPNANIVYSDEDKVTEHGSRQDPYFKPDWNSQIFYSHNLICHLGVYRTSLLKEIGGFRKGYEGAQDYDLALRCVERIDENTIFHIPRILYHWRIHSASTANSSDAKPYAIEAGRKALQDHFDKRKIDVIVESNQFGYRVKYTLPRVQPLVSIVIPTRNGVDLLRQCIESVLSKTTYQNFEIIIVDNDSNEEKTLKYLKKISRNQLVRVIKDTQPFNYAAINNGAVNKANGELICLMNNDIEVKSPAWLSEMVSLVLQERTGVVGAKLLYPNNTLQHAGVVLGIGGVGGHAFKYQPQDSAGYFNRAQIRSNYSVVTAACLLVSKTVYHEVGGLETKLAVAFNDVDFCLKVREAGYQNVLTPHAVLYHHESASRGSEDSEEKKKRFASEVKWMLSKWGEALTTDPAYNPNLTLEHEDFSLAWPPRTKSVESLLESNHV